MNDESLEELVHAHQAELYRYVKYMGADSATAEDVVQDVFIAAFRSKKYPDLDNIRLRAGWLRGIARNTFLKYCRRMRRDQIEFNTDNLEAAETYWARQYLSHDEGFGYLEALQECLNSAPEKSRNLLTLRYSESRSRSQMAQILRMTEDAVKKALQRIRKALQECLESRLHEELS